MWVLFKVTFFFFKQQAENRLSQAKQRVWLFQSYVMIINKFCHSYLKDFQMIPKGNAY